jgi:16S rRNA (cytidine1402-2'-O)-methyltransferase
LRLVKRFLLNDKKRMTKKTNLMKGKIYLIPTPLGENALHTIPVYVVEIIHSLNHFIVERAKVARHFIKETNPPYPLSILTVFELDQEKLDLQLVDYQEVKRILDDGRNVGLMSDAGCPGVADPGAKVVSWAHKQGFEVMPLVGPSSILLALMGSGMNGQSFAFQGYLSAKREDLGKELKRLEDLAKRSNQTQIFIEAPYRNRQVIDTALKSLNPQTKLCIAADISLTPQYLVTKTITKWQKTTIPDLHKHAAIFLIGV